ncbi:MAG: DNA translocase FtsK [Fimbriimonadaceae bacterium]|nr:DNA translocase FtsK [Fimbriimonadaceae bacterium]
MKPRSGARHPAAMVASSESPAENSARKEAPMSAKSRSKKPSAAAPSGGVPAPRTLDIVGVSLVALALLIWIGLGTAQAGLLGDFLTATLSGLFGRGAWLAPLPIGLAGIALITGRGMGWRRFAWGLGLGFCALLAGMAQDVRGDFFDVEAVRNSGGYLGAALGSMLHALLGTAKPIGIGLMAVVALVLCADEPVRMWIARTQAEARRAKTKLREIARVRHQPDGSADEAERRRMAPLARDASPESDRAPVSTRTLEPGPADLGPVGRAGAIGEAGRPRETIVPTERPKPEVRRPRDLVGLGAEMEAKAKAEAESVSLPTDVEVPETGYQLPPIELLNLPAGVAPRSAAEMQRNIETLEGTLEQFGIDANVVEVAAGPSVTRYEVQLGPGVRVNRITALADNIAMDLAASAVRVEAPIPGKAAIGVEVPNAVRTTVTLRECCDVPAFREGKSPLMVALGKDVAGDVKFADLTRMPHLLIGGATNSGKSIGLATLITSLLMRNSPKDLRLVMIDPKRVELTLFDRIPHLMCPVIKEVKEAAGVLRAVWREMDRRYDLFNQNAVRNIDGWNAQASYIDRLPYIVVIIDELADLMIQCGPEVETVIVRLAQLARAVGIHLVIATQRPSVDVITGLIKANIPSRIAFSVASQIDSRTILDAKGAENLIGRGDMLFQPIDAMKPIRIQGCFVSEKEIDAVCRHWRAQQEPEYVLTPIEAPADAKSGRTRDDADEEVGNDELWEDAVTWVAERGEASTSMLQRKFKIGFQRASRLLDVMEERGIVGPRDGPRPRDVLVSPLELDAVFGRAARYDVGGTLDDDVSETVLEPRED